MSVVKCNVAGGVGRILLNRPAQMNAVTVEFGERLESALRDLGARTNVNVILVRGAGGNFSAGGDFQEVERLRAKGPDALSALFANFGRACAAVAEVKPPVVAAVEGVAMAGGFEFMQAADVVLVHDDARIADNHVNFGQVPGGGSSQRLPRLIGRQRALGLLLSGEQLSGPDAVAYGLAYRSFAPEEFDEQVEAFVATMAKRRPDALSGIKRLVHDGLATTLQAGLALELDRVVAHISGEAGEAGVDSFSSKGVST